MVFVLLIVMVGAVVMAGWAHLLASRAHFTEEADLAQHRRLALHNSRALADQWILSGAAAGTVSPTTAGFTVSGTNWGNFRIADTASNALTTSNTFAWSGNRNPFSPMGAGGYVTNVSAILFQTNTDRGGTNRTTILTRTYAIRSRSPVAAGYPLVLHTNAAATNFAGVSVLATNAPALVYAQPSSAAAAPVSPLYFAPEASTVLTSTNLGAPVAQMIEFPFAPLTSGASGYVGQLDTPVPRIVASADLSSNATESFPAPPSITDILKDDGTSEYRTVGIPPSQVEVSSVEFDPITTDHGLSNLLIFGQQPDNPPEKLANEMRLFYFGEEFLIRYSSQTVQYWVDPDWETLDPDEEILILNGNGTLTVEDMDSTESVELVFAQKVAILVPPKGSLIVFSNDSIHLRGGPSYTAINGAAVFRKSEYFTPGGVAFFLVPGQTLGGAFQVGDSMLSRLSPAVTIRCDLLDSMRLVQMETDGTSYSINDNAGEPLLEFRPSETPSLYLAASAASASPVLHHVSSVSSPVTNGTPITFRRWLGVFDPTQTINPANSVSAMLFGYLDTGTATLGLEDDENGRLTALDYSGEAGGLNLHVPANRDWNLSAVFAGTPVDVISAGEPTLLGGIRTDRNFSTSAGRIGLAPDTTGSALEPFLDRIGWIESWQE
ncbi:MAG: hypothetical protein Fur0032_15530 [Terrimicrobiaceae bacterium]